MALQMKLKVADKPLRCIAVGQFADQDVVLTGAGEYGDEEALLRWRRDPNSVGEKEECPVKHEYFSPLLFRVSGSTTRWWTSAPGAASGRACLRPA
jgi:hypothetical protein